MPVMLTTAVNKIAKLYKKIRIVSGGTGGSKTFSIMMLLADYCQSVNGEKVDVVSESFPHLENGAMSDFKTIMRERKYWKDERWHDTKHEYTFESGSILKFISFDKLGKAHGPRRDVLFINEGNYLPWAIVDQLITRTRKIVFVDYNPSEEFWADTELIGKRDDVQFIGEGGDLPPLTYLDNEALSESEIKEIESHKHNANWWRVYGEGKRGVLEGSIYKNWQIIDDIPFEAKIWRKGLDLGYAVDPTVLIDIYEYNGGYILDEALYAKGLSNKGIADVINNSPHPEILVIADSAEPKSIDEIKLYSVNIIGAQKGAGSVNQGISFVQAQKISITRRSFKTLKAYRNYKWLQDKKTGAFLQVPDDSIHEWSNSMDAVRYGFNGIGTNPNEQRLKEQKENRMQRNEAKFRQESTQ